MSREPPRRHHPWEPPEAEFPGIVPIDALLLGRTEQVAVAITGLSAFSSGFDIFVTARMRPGARGGPDAPSNLGAARRAFRLRDAARRRHEGPRSPRPPPPPLDSEPTEPILHPYMGGGGPPYAFLPVVGVAAAAEGAAGVRL